MGMQCFHSFLENMNMCVTWVQQIWVVMMLAVVRGNRHATLNQTRQRNTVVQIGVTF